MTDVDRLDLLARIGICFKIGVEGSFAVATQGKGCFLCSTNRIWQKPYLSDVCSCKGFFKFRATADRHCYLAWLGRKHTTFTSWKHAACSNELFSLSSRLCFGEKRFDWANVNFGRLLNIFHTERSWHAYWFSLVTGGPSSLHERGRDSCLWAVLCYKRLFTKACMGSIGFS